MKLITGSQIRMARAHLRWSVNELAEAAAVGSATIKRMELHDYVPGSSKVETLEAVFITLEKALSEKGAFFIVENGDGPGIRQTKA